MNKRRYLRTMLPTLLIVTTLLFLPAFSLKLPLAMLVLSAGMLISNLPEPKPVKVQSRSERHY